LLGFGGVTASAFIYLVPARPAWNRKGTVADFYLTGLLLGPLFLGLLGIGVPAAAVVAAGAAQLLNQLVTCSHWQARTNLSCAPRLGC
jgi:anaerobic dimethyl sulfoxide reductase subunit C (anchor subunit)